MSDEQPRPGPSSATPRSRRQLTERLFAVVRRLRSHAADLAGDFGLSFLQVRALWQLEESLPTGELAERLGLDRSNITGVVDGLENLGLVIRRSRPDDRRIKLLALTEGGRQVRSRLDTRLFETLTLFDALSGREQDTLAALLGKILDAAEMPLGTMFAKDLQARTEGRTWSFS